jgi:hypothetical protein
VGENPLIRCITEDEKDLVFIAIIFYLYFDLIINNESNTSNIVEGSYYISLSF